MTPYFRPSSLYPAYIFDLDGTIYLGDALLPTVSETVTLLRSLGRRTVFLSNNPTRSRAQYADRLTRLGLPTPPGDILNSSAVLVDFLTRELPSGRLFVCGEAPLCDELVAAGFVLTQDPRETDAVIASFDRSFTYRKLQIAFDAIRNGARFFATNPDRFCPVPGGGEPDAAAIIAAIEACTGVPVEAIVGKPSRHMIAAILSLVERPPSDCLIAGDRLDTDVQMGLSAGMPAALVLTGATPAAALASSPIRPTFVLESLADLLPAGFA